MNRRLHGPTMELRQYGHFVSYDDLNTCMKAIQTELELFRRHRPQHRRDENELR